MAIDIFSWLVKCQQQGFYEVGVHRIAGMNSPSQDFIRQYGVVIYTTYAAVITYLRFFSCGALCGCFLLFSRWGGRWYRREERMVKRDKDVQSSLREENQKIRQRPLFVASQKKRKIPETGKICIWALSAVFTQRNIRTIRVSGFRWAVVVICWSITHTCIKDG